MNFETLLKQIVKEAVVEALSEVEPKNWTTNDIHEEPHNEAPAPSVEPEEEVTVEEPETEDVDLGSMKLKELREYAEELGLNSKGKRAEVEDRIREFLDNQEDSEDEEVEEPEVEEESEEPEIEENEDSEEAEDDEVEDETYAKVMQYVNEASDDELRETLEELGLSSKGKREALIEKIYQAVKDGLFEFEEEDEEPSEEPDEEVEDTEDTEEEISEDLGITDARLKAIEAMEDQVHEEFEEGKITRKEMVAYLKQVGIAVTKKVEDDDVVEMYTEKLALLIDDEGEFHDEGGDPYNINEVPYCCGAPLEEIEGGYRCNVCGTEYEAE